MIDIDQFIVGLKEHDPVVRSGRVLTVQSTHIEASGPAVSVGTLCEIELERSASQLSIAATVTKSDNHRTTLLPLDKIDGVFCGAKVTAAARPTRIPVGDALLGRAIDPLARPIDALGPLTPSRHAPLNPVLPTPLERAPPEQMFATGIKAIDGLLTLGIGQRIGIFAASGVGKTSLLGQIASNAAADRIVICLVGERGHEVENIWSTALDAETRSRAVMVAATSEHTAAMRARACDIALAIAEDWREQGHHVLFVLDSVTRLAMALREIGLASGEPPVLRGYTPNLFAAMPHIVERCGAIKNRGAITGVFTVLSETDENDDPVCELMKSLLDGHIILSRALAEKRHFPAIDVLRSVSRNAERLVNFQTRQNVAEIFSWLSALESSQTLVDAGLYREGSNRLTDSALKKRAEIDAFVRQDRDDYHTPADTMAWLGQLAMTQARHV